MKRVTIGRAENLVVEDDFVQAEIKVRSLTCYRGRPRVQMLATVVVPARQGESMDDTQCRLRDELLDYLDMAQPVP